MAHTAQTPQAEAQNFNAIVTSSDAQNFVVGSISKVNAAQQVLLRFLGHVMALMQTDQIQKNFAAADNMKSGAITGFATTAAGSGMQIAASVGTTGYGAKASKEIDDKYNKGEGGTEDLKSQISDLDDKINAEDEGVLVAGHGDHEPPVEVQKEAYRAEKEKLKRDLESHEKARDEAKSQKKQKMDMVNTVGQALGGLGKSAGDSTKDIKQAAAQKETTIGTLDKTGVDTLNQVIDSSSQTAQSYAQAAARAGEASQKTAG
ncbi:MAG: hypothetical protein SP1CHLAM54_17800 [Chlamydiia bacterium]|nr:hypothetical protein [Chlamydiia bacterium]MCH9616668.1 hypothetical protein [Chlamydiia bacterium]MCH9629400.1 hypothetical protein [Chlamydiia bacterium]